ncbi:hypothetical protein EGW08_001508 [Elysia chlorotica]|uniref:Uncharacterized protein n=1 Tax=Elysia chlorotica TaxID=188477 RepID=A0A433UA47_ELYCH|nr:hypothetical protein EGW08_001508 [Elysia chlorotica]
MTCTGESPREDGVPTALLTTKNKAKIGTWNTRTLYETGRTAQLSTKLKTFNDNAGRPEHKYNVQCLIEKQKSEHFKIELRNKFSVLSLLPEETIEEQWLSLRETWKETCSTVLGKKIRKHMEWISTDTWTRITERKNLKHQINQPQGIEEKHTLQARYWEKNREVTKSARKDKRNYIEELTTEAEAVESERNMERLCNHQDSLGEEQKLQLPRQRHE